MKRLLMMFVVLCALQVAPLWAAFLTDNGNGTVTESTTGLMWQQGEGGYTGMIWEVATSYCEGLSLGGWPGWRLPTITELASLVDPTLGDPAIDTAYFPGVPPGTYSGQTPYHPPRYWSSTPDAVWGDMVQVMWFGLSPTMQNRYDSSYWHENNNTRCVRSALVYLFFLVPADKKGGPSDNSGTKYDGPLSCPRPGLPVYSVNTSYLNLVVEDTDFAWQSYGHNVNLRRVWNISPDTTGMFGNGWSFSYESTLKVLSGVSAKVALGSGQTLTYFPSTKEATGTITHRYSSPSAKPILTGFISDATGAGYYIFADKNSKLTSRYDYVSTDATTGEKIYRLTSITDRNGNALTLTYDSSARLAKLTDASNRETTFVYDTNNHCTQISTLNGKTVTFKYDATGNLIKNVDLAGNVITYAYNSNKLITSMTAAGKTTGFTYFDLDENKHVSSVTDAMGMVTNYEFLSAGGTKITEPGGGIRTYANSGGLTTLVTDQLNQTPSTAFNGKGLPFSTTDEQGRITGYEYDVNGNLTKLTDPAGKITTFEYDANWNLIKTTDPLGNFWVSTYDANNNLTAITSPLGLSTTFTLDSKGLVTKFTRPDGSVVTSEYDGNGNNIRIANPLDKATVYGFDAYGLELISKTDPNGNTTAFSYDPNRLLTSMTLPNSNKVEFSYSCNALTSATDSGGNTTTYQRDDLLHTTKITNPLGKSSSFAYNSDGLNTSMTDPLGRSTILGYDAAQRMTSITNPLGQTVLFSRNADGSISSITNELGKVTMMSYDARGLLSTITDPLGNVTTTQSEVGRQ